MRLVEVWTLCYNGAKRSRLVNLEAFAAELPPVAASAAWGDITGTLSAQTDLKSELDGKATAGHDHDADYEPIGEVAAHAAELDAHPGYLTAAEGNAAYEALGAVAAHVAASDPHPAYLKQSEGDALYEPLGQAASAVVAHSAASDPHTGYQRESEKGSANGYASLDGSTKVPIAQVPTGTTGSTVALGNHTHPGGAEAFPVGSVFIAVVDTDPATLLGYGTWSSIGAGRVLIGQDTGDAAFDALEETGGAKTVTSTGTVSQPTFTGSALGTHSHQAGTLVPSAHSGAAVADHASHTHTYTDVPNHTHPHNIQGGTTAATTGTNVLASTATGGSARAMAIATSNNTNGVATGTTAGPSATLTHSVTQPSAHTMSGSSEAVSAGTPAGTVSQPTFTGNATSVVQPYLVVKFWKRVS